MSLNFEATALTIVNEVPYEAALGALTAYGITNISTNPVVHPGIFIATTALFNAFQPMLTYAGFDGIFKRKVRFLSPVLSTAAIAGLIHYGVSPLHKVVLSSESQQTALYFLSFVAMVKAVTRITLSANKTTPTLYPSLKTVAVDLPRAGVSTIASLFSDIKNSQPIKTIANKAYWLFTRWSENPCNDPQKEPKEV